MHRLAFAVASILLSILIASPAVAQVVITHAKALAGNVTPGDTPGYPITLSQPGAYRLESNLAVPNGQYGLYVSSNNVDIDMNGFTLSGAGGGTFGVVSGFAESAIRGGIIKSFRYSAIYLRGSGWTVDDMKIVSNGSLGVDATGARLTTVRGSFVAANSSGVQVGDDGRVENSTISRNLGNGAYCQANCTVTGSSINSNGGSGIRIVGDGGHILGNDISANAGAGIDGLGIPNPSGGEVGAFIFGYGNNSIIKNTLGSHFGGSPLQPNFCSPGPC